MPEAIRSPGFEILRRFVRDRASTCHILITLNAVFLSGWAEASPTQQDLLPTIAYQQDSRIPPFYHFKIDGSEYFAHPLGGPGLHPTRTYTIKYGSSTICRVVSEALNRALKHPKAAQVAIMRPLPESVRSATYGHDPSATTYEAKNPLFSDPLFVTWNYLNAAPGLPGFSPDPAVLWNDYEFARWAIIPVLNDGVPRLLYNLGRRGTFIWQVPLQELKQKDWSDWQSYQPFKVEQQSCPADAITPVQSLRSLCELRKNGQYFPRITAREERRVPWNDADRAASVVNFALVKGLYYEILQIPNRDIVIVARPDERPGNDLCYLTSFR